jgi:hypothetical protein
MAMVIAMTSRAPVGRLVTKHAHAMIVMVSVRTIPVVRVVSRTAKVVAPVRYARMWYLTMMASAMPFVQELEKHVCLLPMENRVDANLFVNSRILMMMVVAQDSVRRLERPVSRTTVNVLANLLSVQSKLTRSVSCQGPLPRSAVTATERSLS